MATYAQIYFVLNLVIMASVTLLVWRGARRVRGWLATELWVFALVTCGLLAFLAFAGFLTGTLSGLSYGVVDAVRTWLFSSVAAATLVLAGAARLQRPARFVFGAVGLFLLVSGLLERDATALLDRLLRVEAPGLALQLTPTARQPVPVEVSQGDSDAAGSSVFGTRTTFQQGARQMADWHRQVDRDADFFACFDAAAENGTEPRDCPEGLMPLDKAEVKRVLEDSPDLSDPWVQEATVLDTSLQHLGEFDDQMQQHRKFFHCLNQYSRHFPDGMPIQDDLFDLAGELLGRTPGARREAARSAPPQTRSAQSVADIEPSGGGAALARVVEALEDTIFWLESRRFDDAHLSEQACAVIFEKEFQSALDDEWGEIVKRSERPAAERPAAEVPVVHAYRDMLTANYLTAAGYPREAVVFLIETQFKETKYPHPGTRLPAPTSQSRTALRPSDIPMMRMLALLSIYTGLVGDYEKATHINFRLAALYQRVLHAYGPEHCSDETCSLRGRIAACATASAPPPARYIDYLYAYSYLTAQILYDAALSVPGITEAGTIRLALDHLVPQLEEMSRLQDLALRRGGARPIALQQCFETHFGDDMLWFRRDVLHAASQYLRRRHQDVARAAGNAEPRPLPAGLRTRLCQNAMDARELHAMIANNPDNSCRLIDAPPLTDMMTINYACIQEGERIRDLVRSMC